VAPDPFADLFGQGAGAPAAAPASRPAAAPAPMPSAADALFGAPTVPAPAPARPAAAALFGSPPPAPAPWAPPAPAAAARPASAPPAIPDDWDPFAPDDAAAGSGLLGGAITPASAPLAAPPSAESLDALFGLGGASADPFARSPLAEPAARPNTSTDADPLRAFGISAAPAAGPVSDHVSDLHTPWQAAPLREATPPADAASATPAPAALPGAVLSWHQPSREGKVITLPGVHRPGHAPAEAGATVEPEGGPLTRIIPRSASPSVAPMPAPVSTPTPAATPAPAGPSPATPPAAPWPATSAPPAPTASAAPADWHRALAEGLGLPPERLPPLDAAQLRLMGSLLREATRGAVDLLVARAALKREMRTEVTVIAVRENNPLKFSPSVEVALHHLLGEQLPGFMPPAPAMRDAFDDLRAHQIGFLAGMRAALEGLLENFDPARLESRLEKGSGLKALLPGSRQARSWETFTQRYAELRAEAQDDFHSLFGKAFLTAYEQHIDQLKSDAR